MVWRRLLLHAALGWSAQLDPTWNRRGLNLRKEANNGVMNNTSPISCAVQLREEPACCCLYRKRNQQQQCVVSSSTAASILFVSINANTSF